MKQSHPAIHCDAHHIPKSQKSVEINGELVVASFIVLHVQPCKERAHSGFDFKGDDDRT